MKKSALIIAIISLMTVACTTQKLATSSGTDDVYGSSGRGTQTVSKTTKPQSTGEQVITSPDNSKSQKPVSSSFADDYNDYSYAGRINRFNSKDTTKGYFDDTYSSNSAVSNSGDASPNVSLYLGVGAGYSGFGYSYSPWGFNYGWDYPYSPWSWSFGWGYPYYGYNSWYNPCCYSCGYGYGYGYNDWYGGSYNKYNSVYYGRRTSLSRTDGGRGRVTPGGSAIPSGTAAQTRATRVAPGTRNTGASSSAIAPANQQRYRYSKPSTTRETVNQRNTGNTRVQSSNQSPRQQPAPRYSRPEVTTQAQRTGAAQSYSSPAYRQPKSSQEYLAPRTQAAAAGRNSGQNNGARVGNDNSRQYASPATRTYSQPTRSGPAGNSGSTFSAPSRSGSSGSNSAPARSGGNSDSRSSGSGSGSGSGGRHR